MYAIANQYNRIDSGTSYHENTDPKVIEILEACRINQHRIRVVYGDVLTGISWEDRFDVMGRVGRSTGEMKIPLLIHNRRSMGGGSILTHCIIGIRFSTSKLWLYKHPKSTFDLNGINQELRKS